MTDNRETGAAASGAGAIPSRFIETGENLIIEGVDNRSDKTHNRPRKGVDKRADKTRDRPRHKIQSHTSKQASR